MKSTMPRPISSPATTPQGTDYPSRKEMPILKAQIKPLQLNE